MLLRAVAWPRTRESLCLHRPCRCRVSIICFSLCVFMCVCMCVCMYMHVSCAYVYGDMYGPLMVMWCAARCASDAGLAAQTTGERQGVAAEGAPKGHE